MEEFKLTKAKAHKEIIFKEDKDDNYLIYIIIIERKTGLELGKNMIVKKDMEEFLNMYIDKGWKKTKDIVINIVKPNKTKKK